MVKPIGKIDPVASSWLQKMKDRKTNSTKLETKTEREMGKNILLTAAGDEDENIRKFLYEKSH